MKWFHERQVERTLSQVFAWNEIESNISADTCHIKYINEQRYSIIKMKLYEWQANNAFTRTIRSIFWFFFYQDPLI